MNLTETILLQLFLLGGGVALLWLYRRIRIQGYKHEDLQYRYRLLLKQLEHQEQTLATIGKRMEAVQAKSDALFNVSDHEVRVDATTIDTINLGGCEVTIYATTANIASITDSEVDVRRPRWTEAHPFEIAIGHVAVIPLDIEVCHRWQLGFKPVKRRIDRQYTTRKGQTHV